MGPTTRFLNVDLDIAGPVDLAPLLAALAGSTMVLRHEVGAEGEVATLELLESPATMEDALRGFAALVGALPKSARAIWRRLNVRMLDVGVQGGAEPASFHLAASAEVLAEISRAGIGLAVTVYGAEIGQA